jgi:hypothetical protein
MRLLLRLYPRRMRERYGGELLDLERELRMSGDLAPRRAVRDMILGALSVRSARQRTYLVVGTIAVAAGLAVVVASIAGPGAQPPARAAHSHVRLLSAVPDLSVPCFVVAGSSCSRTPPCSEFIGRPPAAAVTSAAHVTASRRRRTRNRPRTGAPSCAAYPHVRPHRPVFVDG